MRWLTKTGLNTFWLLVIELIATIVPGRNDGFAGCLGGQRDPGRLSVQVAVHTYIPIRNAGRIVKFSIGS